MFEGRGLRVGVFIDTVNIFDGTRDLYGRGPDYKLLLQRAVAGNRLVRAITYAIHMLKEDKWCYAMKATGYEVKFKEARTAGGSSIKADWDMGMAMDVVRMLDRLDLVVLVSGDADFVELLRYCQERGVPVRVFGVPGSTARTLQEAADDFVAIDETMLMPPKERPAPARPDKFSPSFSKEQQDGKQASEGSDSRSE